jgi:hypothetical protein
LRQSKHTKTKLKCIIARASRKHPLGLMAAEKPELREQVEHYYHEIAQQGLTVAVVNAGLQQLMDQGIAYQVLAYKMVRIVRLAGGQIDAEGNITELGKITTGMLEIGKQGYLTALQNSGAV